MKRYPYFYILQTKEDESLYCGLFDTKSIKATSFHFQNLHYEKIKPNSFRSRSYQNDNTQLILIYKILYIDNIKSQILSIIQYEDTLT